MKTDEKKKQAKLQEKTINDVYLQAVKAPTGRETGVWISHLANNSNEIDRAKLEQIDAFLSAGADQQHFNSIAFVDRLFDYLGRFLDTYNRTVTDTQFLVNLERAQFATESIRGMHAWEAVKVFRGRLSTRDWTLVARARELAIEFWYVPTEKVLALTSDDRNFARYMVLEGRTNDSVVYSWFLDSKQISWKQVGPIAKLLFGTLVLIARERIPADSTFRLPEEDAEPGSSPEQSVDFDFNAHDPEFESPFVEACQHETGETRDGHTITPLDEAIEAVNRAMQKELALQAQIGASAFASQDLKAVEQVMQRTLKIKRLQEAMRQAMQGWQEDLREICSEADG